MAVLYFGIRRMEQIVLHYLSDRENLVKILKSNYRKYGKKSVISYKSYHNTEWYEFRIHDEKKDLTYSYKLYAESSKCVHRVTMTEKCSSYNENNDEYTEKQLFYGHAFYSADFYPCKGESKLRCYDISDVPSEGKIVKSMQN